MIDSNIYKQTGLLELYVLGKTSAIESAEIEQLASENIVIAEEIKAIEIALENYALSQALLPSPGIKPFVMSIIDFTDRLVNGEVPSFPPTLNTESTIQDYSSWLNRADMVLPENTDEVYAKIIAANENGMTAIVWLKTGSPVEEHTTEHEKFLIVEGTCDITIGKTVHSLVAGDVLCIPLYINHHVVVTSAIPCKVILQRIAA